MTRSAPAGHTRITQQAISHIVQTVAAQAFDVPPSTVRTHLTDDAGQLFLHLTLPVPAPPLLQLARSPEMIGDLGGSLPARAASARRVIAERTSYLTGTQVGGIDIALSGVHEPGQEKLQ